MTQSDRESAASDSTSIFAGGLFSQPEGADATAAGEDVIGLENT